MIDGLNLLDCKMQMLADLYYTNFRTLAISWRGKVTTIMFFKKTYFNLYQTLDMAFIVSCGSTFPHSQYFQYAIQFITRLFLKPWMRFFYFLFKVHEYGYCTILPMMNFPCLVTSGNGALWAKYILLGWVSFLQYGCITRCVPAADFTKC